MRIILDEYKLQEQDTDCFIVDDKASYLQARKFILKHKLGKKPEETKLLVQKHPFSKWFSDLEKEEDFEFQVLLPSNMLIQRYGPYGVDQDLTEADIIQLNLVKNGIEPRETPILNSYIGGFLYEDLLLKERLLYLTSFISGRAKFIKSSKYLTRKLHKYLENLESKERVAIAIINIIRNLEAEVCSLLSEVIYASNAPDVLKEVIHENTFELKDKLGVSANELTSFLEKSHCVFRADEKLDSKLHGYFVQLFRSDRKSFFKLKPSYGVALRAFLKVSKVLSSTEKEWILENYSSFLSPELEKDIQALVKPVLVQPPAIQDLTLSDQYLKWAEWAINSFIPYKFFLDKINPTEEELQKVEAYSCQYSDWLFENYNELIHSTKHSNFHIVDRIHDWLYKADTSVIWLIIDGFPAAYSNLLQSILKSHDIKKISNTYRIAALPTITEIGISTQINGKFESSSSYTTNRQTALENAFSTKKVVYSNEVKNFSRLLSENSFDVCCLHWKAIDEFMHKEDSQIDGERIDEVAYLLEKRIAEISHAMKANISKKVKLFISTDHGQTKCLSKGKSINSKALKDLMKDKPKERCVQLTSSIKKENIDPNEVYHLTAQKSEGKSDWLIAKGYRYFGNFDYGYRHGGLSPEETIVPYLSCEIADDTLIDLIIKYSGSEELELGFTKPLRLQIENKNNVHIQLNKISVDEDKNCLLPLVAIEPISSTVIEGNIKLPKTLEINNDKAFIYVNISYNLFGDEINFKAKVTVPVKQARNAELDDLFS